jgi:hypothetical protein
MKSISLITIILTACSASTVLTQQCNNLLLNYFGFQHFNSPQSGADLPYCNHLKSSLTCCSAETVSTFQDRADEIADKLNNYDAARDLFLAELNNQYYNQLVEKLKNINDNHLDELQEIRRTDVTLADQLQADIRQFTRVMNAASLILKEYQEARVKCFKTAMSVRASAWCLACDPNYANEGLNDDGTVSFSDPLCQTITGACWEYFNEGARFNPLIEVRDVYWKLRLVSGYLDRYPKLNASVLNTPDPYRPISSQLAVTVPEKWASGDGDCWDFWAGDNLLVEIFTFNSAALIGAEQIAMIYEEEANIEFAGTEDGLKLDRRMLFDGRMLFGVFDVIEETAQAISDPGTSYDVYEDPGYYYGSSNDLFEIDILD